MKKAITILLVLGFYLFSFSNNHSSFVIKDEFPSILKEKNTIPSCPLKDPYKLDIYMKNGQVKVRIIFNSALDNNQEVRWKIRNLSMVGPNAYLKKGKYDLNDGYYFELDFNFNACNSYPYEISVKYKSCGQTLTKNIIISKPKISYEILNTLSNGFRGHIKSSSNSFPIEAITNNITWEISGPGVPPGSGIFTLPSSQKFVDFKTHLGFNWVECGKYTFNVSYKTCNGQIKKLGEQTINYSSQLHTGGNPILTSSNGNSRSFNGIRYVRNGKTVTIENSTLKFEGENSGIVVETGGRLIIINSTIEGMCNSIWGGITVEGDPTKSINISNQGSLLIYKNSIIQNAKIGVKTSNGGMVGAIRSSFINNEIAFHGTDKINANIFFRGCSFETNNDILFNKMKYFVYLNNTSAIFKAKNKFRNKQTSLSNQKDYGIGILSYYSNLVVGNPPFFYPNIFENLYNGIDYYNSYNSGVKLNVYKSEFNNVNKGISTSKSEGDIIAKNKFKIADITVSNNGFMTLRGGWGVHTNGCVNHIVTENKFTGATFSYGIINSQIGYSPQNLPVNNAATGKLYLNTFENTRVAIQIQGPNVQTQISCNDFTNNNQFAINVKENIHNGTTYNGRLGNLGSCSSGQAANNWFDLSMSCTNTTYRHINLNGSLPASYYNFGYPTPSCTDPNVNLVLCTKTAVNNCDPLQYNSLIKKSSSTVAISLPLNKGRIYKNNQLLDLYVAPLSKTSKNVAPFLINKKDITTIYPNPSYSGKFNISIKDHITYNNTQVEIIDISGKLLLRQDLTQNKQQIDISTLSKGIYFIKVFEKNKVIGVNRLIYK